MTDMCVALKSVADAFPEMRLESAKDSITKLLKVIVEASQYVKEFQNKGKAGEKSNNHRVFKITYSIYSAVYSCTIPT